MIYILTYADMNGVGADIYNSFNARLIKTLYRQAVEVLGNTAMLDEAAKRSKKRECTEKTFRISLFKKIRTEKNTCKCLRTCSFYVINPNVLLISPKKHLRPKIMNTISTNGDYLVIEIIREKSFNSELPFRKTEQS